jgi:serine/threonine protein kinase
MRLIALIKHGMTRLIMSRKSISTDESSGLEWNTRYEIIKGICRGLNFLHERDNVHLDLKSQNILMDANMIPKIVDFGLSRFMVKPLSLSLQKSSEPGKPTLQQ